ncbi:MAG: hypothetical protein EAZ65_07615 [Verrucomicrobia bacterium]|nr:MAG: hypothetical protein EAZ84_04425 [Verrucomicrobiota bacterium]TAE87108.1 MAG: hypothetical protein EAZ82_08580 [Verrucomicrobiota bacterium]TAF24912.1 MAG: hypothetical protein EAZ71_08805 [Verrucomicrobiota bacterium]TAF40761.1 MAG: hypothetical protein EAZ65_07615 [Verrucomicrobiota bacterium]
MRALIFTAGILLAVLGMLAFKTSGNPTLLQGGLTLGGGWIICGLFSLRSKWHGFIGAGLLAFLGGIRSLPALPKLAQDPTAAFSAAAALLCTILLIAVVRCLLAERQRIAIERLKAGHND